MGAVTPCPDLLTLRNLLCDDLASGVAGPVEAHVDACPGCQRVLQRLVESLPETLAGALPEPPAPGDDEPPQLPGYEALGRIDAGTYGRCEECGEMIAKPRLQALPYTRHCIECARALESRG